jgi:hypothetical protein
MEIEDWIDPCLAQDDVMHALIPAAAAGLEDEIHVPAGFPSFPHGQWLCTFVAGDGL